MDKELNWAIMVKSKLRNKFLWLKTEENRLACVRQWNYGVNLLRQKKRMLRQIKHKFYNWQQVVFGKVYVHYFLPKTYLKAHTGKN